MRSMTACEALQSGRRVEVSYDNYVRVVEVHAVGVSKEGNGLMRVWQVRGGSVSGERAGWKLLRLDETRDIVSIDEQSEAPRSGYRKGDAAMAKIICEL